MAKVTNNYTSRIALPDGTEIAPGETVEVKRWAAIKDHAVVSEWVDGGVITVVETKADAKAAKAADAQAKADADKAAADKAAADAEAAKVPSVAAVVEQTVATSSSIDHSAESDPATGATAVEGQAKAQNEPTANATDEAAKSTADKV